jgi:lyso-ornithine lipid O-acyltransferase
VSPNEVLMTREFRIILSSDYRIPPIISRGLSRLGVFLRAAGLFATVLLSFVVFVPIQAAILWLFPKQGQILPQTFYELVLRLVKVRVKVSGHLSGDAALVVANHVSWTDIPALGAQFPATFVAKSEISRWPIIRSFARRVNTIFVDRGDRKTIPAANALMLERIKAGAHVVLFPEATTYADGPHEFHSSHFAIAEALRGVDGVYTIQPVAIRYSASHAPWIGDDALLPHVLRLMDNPPVTCELIFCDPLRLDQVTSRRALAQECFDRIDAALRGKDRC